MVFPERFLKAEALRDSEIAIDHVVEVSVDDDEIIERMAGRRVHLASGRTYHIIYNPPKKMDMIKLVSHLSSVKMIMRLWCEIVYLFITNKRNH